MNDSNSKGRVRVCMCEWMSYMLAFHRLFNVHSAIHLTERCLCVHNGNRVNMSVYVYLTNDGVYATLKGNSTKQVSGQCLIHIQYSYVLRTVPCICCCFFVLKSSKPILKIQNLKTTNACERNGRVICLTARLFRAQCFS